MAEAYSTPQSALLVSGPLQGTYTDARVGDFASLGRLPVRSGDHSIERDKRAWATAQADQAWVADWLKASQPAWCDLADGSRAIAKDSRSKKAAAPAPNKAHCQVAKMGRSESLSRQICPPREHWVG